MGFHEEEEYILMDSFHKCLSEDLNYVHKRKAPDKSCMTYLTPATFIWFMLLLFFNNANVISKNMLPSDIFCTSSIYGHEINDLSFKYSTNDLVTTNYKSRPSPSQIIQCDLANLHSKLPTSQDQDTEQIVRVPVSILTCFSDAITAVELFIPIQIVDTYSPKYSLQK